MVGDSQQDISIRMGIDLLALKQSLAESKAILKSSFSTFDATKVVNLQNQIKGLSKELSGTGLGLPKSVSNTLMSSGAQAALLSKELGKVNTMGKAANLALHKMDVQIKKNKGEFQGWALSIMFAGMALQRMAQSLWTFGTKTFADISHSVEGLVTGTDNLNGAWTYLGFTIGQALDPIADILAPIIEQIADWVSQNEGLVAGFVVVAGVLGTILAVVGSTVLAVAGLMQGWAIAGPAIMSVISGIGTAIAALAATIGVPIWAAIAIITAAILALVALWQSNLGDIQTFFKNTFGIIYETIVGVLKNIWGVFKGVFTLIKGIFTGDLGMVWDGIKMVIANLISGIAKLVLGLVSVVANAGIWVLNTLQDLVLNILRLVTQAIEGLLGLAAEIPVVGALFSGLRGVMKSVNAGLTNEVSKSIDYVSVSDFTGITGALDSALDPWLNPTQTGSTVNNTTNTITINQPTDSQIDEILKATKQTS